MWVYGVCGVYYFVKCKAHLVKEHIFVSKFSVSLLFLFIYFLALLFLIWHQNVLQMLGTKEKHNKSVMKVLFINS